MDVTQLAIDFVLQQEDRQLSGAVTTTPGDKGGRTRFGVAEASHPGLAATGFYSCPAPSALAMAEHIYAEEYGRPLRIGLLRDPALACMVLSLAVNCGPRTAAKMLQSAAGVDPDGWIGQRTIEAVNGAQDPDRLLRALAAGAEAHYRAIVAADPSQDRFLQGWLNRAAEPLNQAAQLRAAAAA